MDTSIFLTVYNSGLPKGKDFEDFCNAHIPVEVEQGMLLLKAGMIAREFYLVEKGMFRSYVYNPDYAIEPLNGRVNVLA